MPDGEHTLTRLLRERGHHLIDPNLWARARAEALAAETDMPADVESGLSAAREREQAYAESVYQPDPAEFTPAYREAWARGLPRHPVEDGPGSSVRVELSVSVLVGTERSTVIVADPVTGRALTREVLPHGREADVAAAAVESAIRARLPGDPGGVPGGVPEPLGEPRE